MYRAIHERAFNSAFLHDPEFDLRMKAIKKEEEEVYMYYSCLAVLAGKILQACIGDNQRIT